MKLLRQVAPLPAELHGGAVAIGNFDGVHLGHAAIVARVLEKARELGKAAVVFTFDPHPVRILRPHEAPPPLTWTDRKAKLLAELGIDAVIAYPTDAALLSLTPQEFFGQIVRDGLDARALVEGPNFYFGRGRAGTIDVLRQLSSAAGISLDVVEPVVVDGDYVSSSRIRTLIAGGDVEAARHLLTRPYRIRGTVVRGAERGAQLGFGTANLDQVDTLLPGHGVYAGCGTVGRRRFAAAVNVGPSPTFGEESARVEAHLIGWGGAPLYGETVEVDFLRRLRDIQRFPGVEAIKEQLRKDVHAANQAFQQIELSDKLAASPRGDQA